MSREELAAFRDEVAARVPVSEVVGRRVTWDLRRSHPSRGEFWAPCPFHSERSASFHVLDGKGFWKCFGCGAKGDAFGFLMQLDGLGFMEALREVASLAGMELPGRGRPDPQAREAAGAARARREAERAEREERARRLAEGALDRALRLWREAHEAEAPGAALLRDYLAARGVDLDGVRRALGGRLPPTLRLHPGLPCFDGGDEDGRPRLVHEGPAMLGLIGRRGARAGVHRTWITPTGRARLADGRKVPKQWLGRTGAMAGCPVVLAPPAARMVAGEGIETVLAALGRIGAPGWGAEAALSLGALCGPEDAAHRRGVSRATGRLLPSAVPDRQRGPAWEPPPGCGLLWLLAEGSEKDPEAAERHYLRARRRHQLTRGGAPRDVRVFLPGGDWAAGLDFADVAAGIGP